MASVEAKSTFSLDPQQQSSFIKYFKSLPIVSDVCFRAFYHGEYYSVHGKDALLTAREYFKTTTRTKFIGKEKIPTVNLSSHNFEAVGKFLLITKNYRLEIYQCEKSKGNKYWSLAYKASPGNLSEVEDIIFGSGIPTSGTSCAIIAIKYSKGLNGQHEVGVGYVDAVHRDIQISQFQDNEIFSNLESVIIQLGAKECLLPKMEATSESIKLREILKRSGILVTEQSRKSYDAKDISQDLNRIVRKNKKTGVSAYANMNKDLLDNPLSASCLSAAISYLELLNKEDHFDQYTFKTHKLGQYMRLDKAAYRALSLFSSDPNSSRLSTPNSLYALLNHCSTNQGKRLLSQWIKQPLFDKNLLQERLDLVEIFFDNIDLSQTIMQHHMRNMTDIERLAKKFCNKRATLQDCYKVYQSVKALPHLCECLEQYTGNNQNLIREVFSTPFHESTLEFTKYEEMVESTLDMNRISKLEFRVKPEFDAELQRLSDLMEEALGDMQEEFYSAAQDLGLEAEKTIKLESTSQHGYFFRIACKAEKCLRGNRRFTQIDTTKAGVRFVSKKLRDFNSKYQENNEMFIEQQSAIVNEILGIAGGYIGPMSKLGRLLAKLDVLISFAQASSLSSIPFVKPSLAGMDASNQEVTSIELMQCRHPCLEVQDNVAFIPNDIVLKRHQQSFLVITGPNMGGKSTYILQAGISVLMAQIGCFVPCSQAKISMVDAILARVGAGDSQVQGVSTFMSEMLEASSLLRSATPNSLVIIDELGRGTSTYDGFGLAWAISQNLTKEVGCWGLFATHFHELTALADECQNVANFHVTALTSKVDDQDTLTMLYQVKPGVCDQSFGIHVAECVHFPSRVLEAAKRKAKELEDCYITLPDEEENGDGRLVAAKKRKIKQEGENIIDKFLQDVESCKSSPDYKIKLLQLKRQVVAKENIYVMKVLSRIGVDQTLL